MIPSFFLICFFTNIIIVGGGIKFIVPFDPVDVNCYNDAVGGSEFPDDEFECD